jgi:DNA-binding CsgD family transcriptional regulator
MDPIRNPYAPGAGTQPPELAGRDAMLEQSRIAIGRLRAGRHAKSFIAVGLRGVGKTVLLNRVGQLAGDAGYKTCALEAQEQRGLPELLIPHLRKILLSLDRMGALAEKVKLGLRVLASFMRKLKLRYADAELTLDIDPEIGSADSGDLDTDLTTLFIALGEAALARNVPIAILIDEVQYLTEPHLAALITAMHHVSQRSLPILLAATGLPQVVGLTGQAKSYAERLFDFPVVDALSASDSATALQRPAVTEGATWDDEALHLVRSLTHGYPYFLQEWGYHTWNVAAGPAIKAQDVHQATRIAIARLDESFFRVRYDRLTPRERDYLRAMAELGSTAQRSGDIADRLGVRVQSVGPLRTNLIKKGMIYSPAHGDTAFTVPLFDEYLRRTIPDWTPRAN